MKYRNLKRWKYELLQKENYKTSIRGVSIDTEYFSLDTDGWLSGKLRYAWDGPSGPTFDTPTNMRASLFHDILCQMIALDLLDRKHRKYADELLRTLMLEDQLKDADGTLVIYGANGRVLYQSRKKKGLKRAIYLRWGRFRANGYYTFVRAYSKIRGM